MKWGSIFSKAGLGAAVGGILGSVVPGVGTAWGAAAGAALAGANEARHVQQDEKTEQIMAANFQKIQQMSQATDPVKLNTYDPQYFNQLAAYANNPNDSAWLKMTKDRLSQEQTQRAGDIQAQIASNQQNAFEQLATRGGVRRGDSLRLAESGSLAGLLAKQRLAAETSAKTYDASIAEQQNKLNVLSRLPGFEQGRAQGDLRNLMDKYRADMAAWAAHEQGQALLHSQSGGLFS